MKTNGLGKILHIFAAFVGMLPMLPLIPENSPFPCINLILLNKIILEIRTFSSFLKCLNPSGTGSKAILLQTTRHGISFS